MLMKSPIGPIIVQPNQNQVDSAETPLAKSDLTTKAFCGGLEEVIEGTDEAYLKSPGCDVSPAAKDPHGPSKRRRCLL